MPLLSRRLDQIIARRRHAKTRDPARVFPSLKHQLDGITDALPTTTSPYKRTPFIFEHNPNVADIPPEVNNIINDRAVKFGTITEYPLDNLANQHPRLRQVPPSELPDWNRHAPVLLDFIDFLNPLWNDETAREVLYEYWNQRYVPAPTLAIAAARREEEALRARNADQQQAPVPEEIEVPQAVEQVDVANAYHQEDSTLNDVTENEYQTEEEDTYTNTSTTAESTKCDHPSDEDTTNNDDTSSEGSTPSKRQRRFNQYVPGPCVSCTFNNSFCRSGGRLLDTGIYGTTLFTHLDTSGHQFPILPGVEYHFNDVTVSLRENRTGLNILAVCPEVINIDNVQEGTTKTNNNSRKRKFYNTKDTRKIDTASTDNSNSSSASEQYPDYSDYITVNGEDNTESSPTLSTTNALHNLAVSDSQDTTTRRPGADYDTESEAGDCILLYTTYPIDDSDTTIV
jgi:hypothetical protein